MIDPTQPVSHVPSRRIGGLEKSNASFISLPAPSRRIGGLENFDEFCVDVVHPSRRIGGLETD